MLGQFECAPNAQSVEAGKRLLRNIETEAAPKKERFQLLRELSAELQREQFHGSAEVRQRERELLARWNTFLALLGEREQELDGLEELAKLLEELDTLAEELVPLHAQLRSRDVGRQLADADELLKAQELAETDMLGKADQLKALRRRAGELCTMQSAERQKKNESKVQQDMLQGRLDAVGKQFDLLQAEARARRVALQKAREFFQFVQHFEEQSGWLSDQLGACGVLLQLRDLSALREAQRLRKALEAEMQSQWERTKRLITDGERLGVPDEVQWRVDALQR